VKATTERVRDLTARIAKLEADAERDRAEFARFDRALEGLMRAVLQEVVIDYNHPTSIACGRLIAAVEAASRTIHNRG
jgi:hypothetical protein